MTRNDDLRISVEALAKKALPVFEAHVAQHCDEQHDTVLAAIALSRLEPGIKDTEEFKDALIKMRADTAIMALQGKLVGDAGYSSLVDAEDKCLFSFLTQLYWAKTEFHQSSFDAAYGDFEDLFYSESLKFRESSQLSNFTSPMADITLTDDVKIVRAQLDVPQAEDCRPFQNNTLFKSPFEIERISSRKKIVKRAEYGGGDVYPDMAYVAEKMKNDEDTGEAALDEQNRSAACFDNVVTSLRILKPSGVYREEEIKTESITFQPNPSSITQRPFHRSISLGEKCAMEPSDVEELQKTFQFLELSDDKRFTMAANRLSSGNERRNLEDSLIDYMIGLEVLYLPDGNQELSFRVAMRVAHVIENAAHTKHDIFEFIRNMYKKRSNIVHGSSSKGKALESHELESLEGFLRASLKKWIENSDVFSVETLNKVLFN